MSNNGDGNGEGGGGGGVCGGVLAWGPWQNGMLTDCFISVVLKNILFIASLIVFIVTYVNLRNTRLIVRLWDRDLKGIRFSVQNLSRFFGLHISTRVQYLQFIICISSSIIPILFLIFRAMAMLAQPSSSSPSSSSSAVPSQEPRSQINDTHAIDHVLPDGLAKSFWVENFGGTTLEVPTRVAVPLVQASCKTNTTSSKKSQDILQRLLDPSKSGRVNPRDLDALIRAFGGPAVCADRAIRSLFDVEGDRVWPWFVLKDQPRGPDMTSQNPGAFVITWTREDGAINLVHVDEARVVQQEPITPTKNGYEYKGTRYNDLHDLVTSMPEMCHTPYVDAGRVVRFNVGGRQFAIKLGAIQAATTPNTKLASIVAKHTLDEEIFIDRDSDCFQIILNWYRSGQWFVPPTVSPQQLEQEAAYFKVPYTAPAPASAPTPAPVTTPSPQASSAIAPLSLQLTPSHPFPVVHPEVVISPPTTPVRSLNASVSGMPTSVSPRQLHTPDATMQDYLMHKFSPSADRLRTSGALTPGSPSSLASSYDGVAGSSSLMPYASTYDGGETGSSIDISRRPPSPSPAEASPYAMSSSPNPSPAPFSFGRPPPSFPIASILPLVSVSPLLHPGTTTTDPSAYAQSSTPPRSPSSSTSGLFSMPYSTTMSPQQMPPTPPKPSRIVEDLPYFHGPLTAAQSEKLLKGKPAGAFLARNSESSPTTCVVLVVVDGNGNCLHSKVYKTPSNTYCTVERPSLNDKEYPSLDTFLKARSSAYIYPLAVDSTLA
eukprot:TRINITY_DN374_c0_g1_i2.p1 TRINITY_DN374_c0_g1~~TRINITY_DN374_c0_g1_i2.p1  ORF type:complete len:770 (+),score=180.07 TRINITY_DN374_c0_g1_i2:85-2394(+)